MLELAGWLTAKYPVPCCACSKSVTPGDRVYSHSVKDPYNVYCEPCGVKAERSVQQLRNGEREPYYLVPR